MARSALIEQSARRTRDALWYKDAIFYEVHVRSFHDSNGATWTSKAGSSLREGLKPCAAAAVSAAGTAGSAAAAAA